MGNIYANQADGDDENLVGSNFSSLKPSGSRNQLIDIASQLQDSQKKSLNENKYRVAKRNKKIRQLEGADLGKKKAKNTIQMSTNFDFDIIQKSPSNMQVQPIGLGTISKELSISSNAPLNQESYYYSQKLRQNLEENQETLDFPPEENQSHDQFDKDKDE